LELPAFNIVEQDPGTDDESLKLIASLSVKEETKDAEE
jgi:hypothetical protein